MLPYLTPLQLLFEHHADADNARHMSRYMRDQFDFYGIKTPERRRILGEFIKQNGLPGESVIPSGLSGRRRLVRRRLGEDLCGVACGEDVRLTCQGVAKGDLCGVACGEDVRLKRGICMFARKHMDEEF
jgi:hypothetical protein